MTSLQLLATINLAVGGLVFLLGLLILRENPGQRLNRVVSLMLFFGGFGSLLAALSLFPGRAVTAGAASPAGSAQHLAYLWEFFFPTLFLFASVFPQERRFARRRAGRSLLARLAGFEVLVFLPHAVHFLLWFLGSEPISMNLSWTGLPKTVTWLFSVGGVLIGLFLSIHAALFSLVNLGFGVAAVSLLADSYRRARMPRLREQLRVIGVGLAACLGLYALAALIPTLFELRISSEARSALTAAALAVGSGSIAYAIVRHKFLDAKLLARRGILYGAATAALVGLYLAVVVQLNRLLPGVPGIDGRILEPVLLVFALVVFQPALGRLEELLDRALLRDPSDHRTVLRNLGQDLIGTLELEAMLTRSIRTIAECLLLQRAHVAALPRDGLILHSGAGEPPPFELREELRRILPELPGQVEGLRLSEPIEGLDPSARRLLAERLGLALVIPLRWRGETVGGLLLGEKITGTPYTSEDVALLTTVAGHLSVSLQNALLVRDQVEVARLEEELRLARRIQKSFLVSRFPTRSRFEVHAFNIPSKEVGGDLYDLVPTGDGGLVLAIADVAGKGVPAALLSSMLQAALRTQAGSIRSVAEMLRNMNALAYRDAAVHQFATFFLARLEDDGRMVFSNAGHNYPILVRRGGAEELLERGGLVLGVLEEARYEEGALVLDTGDLLVLYTDGITEAVNAAGEQFGEQRLRAVLRTLPRDLPARRIAGSVLTAVQGFLGEMEPRDDMTLLVLRVLEPGASRVVDPWPAGARGAQGA